MKRLLSSPVFGGNTIFIPLIRDRSAERSVGGNGIEWKSLRYIYSIINVINSS